jgi:hypothetical protein
MITTVMESSYYGHAMSTACPGGIVIVKTAKLLIVAVFSEPAMAATVIPHVMRFVNLLPTLLGPV